MASTSINEKIQDALKEGYSMDQIRGFLSKSDNEEARNYLKASEAAQAQAAADANRPTPYPPVPLLDMFGGPVGVAIGAGLAGSALTYGATKLADKFFRPQPPAPPTPPSPVFSYSSPPLYSSSSSPSSPSSATATQMGPGEEFYRRTQGTVASTPQDKALLEKSYQAMLDKQAAAAARQAVVPPTNPTPPVFTQAPVAPSATSVAPAATPIAPAPAAPIPTTFAGATVAEPPVAAPTAPAQAAKPPAEKTKSTFKSAADIPSGYVFRPDVGNLDRGLFNILGPEHRLYAKELLNNGMPFGDAGPKDYNQRIAQITEQYWKAVQGQTPETILSREARTAQGVPHGEFGTYGSLGRKAKVAGVAGTLLSAAEAALAAQQGRYGEAAVRGMDVATDFIPGVAAAKQALAPQGVAPGTVPGNILDAAAKLGSPYYETEWARTQRMREAAGAGRGFVNPPLVR